MLIIERPSSVEDHDLICRTSGFFCVCLQVPVATATPKQWMERRGEERGRKRRREERWMEKEEETRRGMESGTKSWTEKTREV